MNDPFVKDTEQNDGQDEFAIKLARLFAERHESLPNDKFVPQLLMRLHHEYRVRQIKRWCIIIAVMLLAGVITPWILRGTVGLFSLAVKVSEVPYADVVFSIGAALAAVAALFWSRRRI